jgi:release factor glutamine methyltransferase
MLVMDLRQWLKQAEKQLAAAGVGTAHLDALVLLENATDISRTRLLAEPGTKLSAAQAAKLEKLLKRRAAHEPLAYIRGRTEFYGRDFVITPAVLEPRPESEAMIDIFKDLAKGGLLDQKGPGNGLLLRIADVGTGSGALGITAALEVPNTSVDLLDIDLKVLGVAKINVDKFTLNISTIKSDLLEQSAKDYDILLCNLPYVPDDYHINQAAGHEPRLAIFGGPDGLDVYRRLFRQISVLPKQPLYILTEALPPQHVALQAIAGQQGYQLAKTGDFIQLFTKP